MSIDKIELRNAFGQFATGVTIITCQADGFAPFGMTVNSFSSLSLDPPLLLWSLQNDSECMAAFNAASQYTVNVLGQHQQELSNQYAKKNDHELQQGHYSIGESGGPVLLNSLASFECDIEQRVAGGDHTIMIGRVTHFNVNGGDPLLFFCGQYKRLAD